MGVLKRDQKTIQGLRSRLNELQGLIDSRGAALTPQQKQVLEQIASNIESDFQSVLTDLQVSNLVNELNDNDKVATVKAVREYVLGAFQLSGPSSTFEYLTIYNDTIKLTHRPHPGLTGIMNYGTGRVTVNGDIHYIDLIETADPYTFTIDSKGLALEGLQIKLQYLYYHDPRDLNDMIGDLIADGLVLITPSE